MQQLSRLILALPFAAVLAQAQSPELRAIMDRLDRLERENQSLARQVQELRAQLSEGQGNGPAAAALQPGGPADTGAHANVAATTLPPYVTVSEAVQVGYPSAPATAPGNSPAAVQGVPPASAVDLAQQVQIQGERIEEQAQTKVEASQKFPIRLAGMALFNTYLNSNAPPGAEYPTAAVANGGRETGGGTLQQTIIGLEFHGPQTFFGGTVRGSLYMDFYNGPEWLRLRTGSIELDWKTRSIMAGVEKPIFNPREPASLAQVGISPLSGAGNLWLWIPQVRVEQDLKFGSKDGLRARLGVVQTREVGPYDAAAYTGPAPSASRPALEGRFEYFHNIDDNRRLEIAPGFHTSTTHVGGLSVPSSLFSLDWFFNPYEKVEFTGAFFTGQNVAALGTGSINEGYVVYRRTAEAIDSKGGWGQFTIHAARRVDLHLFSGVQDYGTYLLGPGDISRNLQYGVNLFVRLAPNVLLGPEISQIRTTYIRQGVRLTNHYDLALAYLF